LTCLALGQAADTPSTAPKPSAQIPTKPLKGKHYFNVAGTVLPPIPIQTDQPDVPSGAHSGKPDWQGAVTVEFGVNENGTVDWARVERGSKKELDAKALSAVAGWVFKPATKGGVPVPVKLAAQVNFKLYK
jgi:TonB family protein